MKGNRRMKRVLIYIIAVVLTIAFLCVMCLYPKDMEDESTQSIYNFNIYNDIYLNDKQKDIISPKSGIFE